jgi:hypothetical protein
VPYIPGILTVERVIRPGAVEELLCLKPADGSKAIIFDLELSMKRSGLCEFIKECDAAKMPFKLETNGGLKMDPAMEDRFNFYREFYGLDRWVVLGVEILQADKRDGKKEEKKASDETKSMKKLDPEPPPVVKKPKPKISKKLEPRAVNIIPASIVWIAEGSIKGPNGLSKTKLSAPLPLSMKLGGHKVGLSSVGLGLPAAGLKSLGGMSRR